MQIEYYKRSISDKLLKECVKQSTPDEQIEDISYVGTISDELKYLLNVDCLTFIIELYELTKGDLNSILNRRLSDRAFIDETTKYLVEKNRENKNKYDSSDYETVIGQKDSNGRVPIGPIDKKSSKYPVSEVPKHLRGSHITLFGPPSSAKMTINALNAYDREIPNSKKILDPFLKDQTFPPMWGADNEDSKTPLLNDILLSCHQLLLFKDNKLKFKDKKKTYEVSGKRTSIPIKRFPGIAIPFPAILYRSEPLPLHLVDFALHFFHHWDLSNGNAYYVPKLENEEEASYIKMLCAHAESLILKQHASYIKESIRLFVVLENPRAMFRLDEIMDELYPYFAGASLGWHDLLASTARIFKEDSQYRIPAKSDPNIVLKYIRTAHEHLATSVGKRGGIKIGGMYGVLPNCNDLNGPSMQISLKGLFKDVIIQFRRGLEGLWIAHPDYIRVTFAIRSCWEKLIEDPKDKSFTTLIQALFSNEEDRAELIEFITKPDVPKISVEDPLYHRKLIVADLMESPEVKNNSELELRYNISQILHYLIDWLHGNGCVALPATIDGVDVRVMDDLATIERGRFELWHEFHWERVSLSEFLQILNQEMRAITRLGEDKWQTVAKNICILLVTDKKPVEFVTEYLMIFTLDFVREQNDPWGFVRDIDVEKYKISNLAVRFNAIFETCGMKEESMKLAKMGFIDLMDIERIFGQGAESSIIDASNMHGTIGEPKQNLNRHESKEQSSVTGDLNKILFDLGEKYRVKFGIKFLISAKGKSSEIILEELKSRIVNKRDEEFKNAKKQLIEISKKRMIERKISGFTPDLNQLFHTICSEFHVRNASICLIDQFEIFRTELIGNETVFQYASLSKTIASLVTLTFCRKNNLSLNDSVNRLLERTKSSYRLRSNIEPSWGDQVTIYHLLTHSALGMHYVKGFEDLPTTDRLLLGVPERSYFPLTVDKEPGTIFGYSGGGFLVLQHLLEAFSEKDIETISKELLPILADSEFSFTGDGIKGDHLHFPAFAAGSTGTMNFLAKLLIEISRSHQFGDSKVIVHNDAIDLVDGIDLGSVGFMGAKMGLGTFVCEMGQNKVMLHQGANDGFRSLYMMVYEGPSSGQGFVIGVRGNDEGTLAISKISQEIIRLFSWSGVDSENFPSILKIPETTSEEIVNKAYQHYIFDFFKSDLPEKIDRSLSQMSEFLQKSSLCNAEVVSVSDQRFARVENLISPYIPQFDPSLFGHMGKIMDSWETKRHNSNLYDVAHFKLKKATIVKQLYISTEFHHGNQAESVSILGRVKASKMWIDLLAKTSLRPHSEHYFIVRNGIDHLPIDEIKIHNYPDGGITRLGIFAEVSKPVGVQSCTSIITQIVASESSEAKNYQETTILEVSNEHYGLASNILSPLPPTHMGDGFETKRSRNDDHFEYVTIGFKKARRLQKISVDFEYFRNNSPLYMELQGIVENQNFVLFEKQRVKQFAGNLIDIQISSDRKFSGVKVLIYPDGGFNRIRFD
ncbi:serine hydrolase [Bacteriovoracaceae bacterium]|nr:serine hydrolase [Bacteriovoracaceae bacterium]